MGRSAILVFLAWQALGARQFFSPADLWLWRDAADPRIAPDGQTVVYTEAWTDPARDAVFSNLWLVSTSNRKPRRWTEGPWCDSSPRWSPDGTRIARLSTRNEVPQIQILRLAGEVSIPIPRLDPPPLNFAWSPDGKYIAYTARVPAVENRPPWAPESILPFLRRPEIGFVSLFIVPVGGAGPPRRITPGSFDCLGDPAWMPDGRSILSARANDIAAFAVSDGSVKVLTKAPGRYSDPLPSPDGNRIAYLFADAKPQSYTVRHLFVMNADGSRVRALAGTLDRDPATPQWSSDSRSIYFLADDHGATRVYAARNDGTIRHVMLPRARLRGFSLADNGRAVAVRSTASEAGTVAMFAVDVPGDPVLLAEPNRRWLQEREIGESEEVHFESAGNTVQGWLVRPPRFDPARKYPLLVDIQDAPRAMCGVEFRLRAQIAAARGFMVLCANPRGTPGYGEQFGNLLRTRYPGDDFDDLMRGVDSLVARGEIDPQRLAVSGGLVAAWAIGHTGRFRSAVVRRPIMDWAIHVATAPNGARRATEWMAAMPWEDPEQYVKHSPLYFAGSLQTPTLVIAGDPDPESESLYFALHQKRVESELLRLPAARKPSADVLELEATLAWLER